MREEYEWNDGERVWLGGKIASYILPASQQGKGALDAQAHFRAPSLIY